MTRLERRTLDFYVKYRHSSPSFTNVLTFNINLVLYWVVMNGIGLALVFHWPIWWAFLFLGAMVGAMLRDLRRMYGVARQWPKQRELLNWDEIERRSAGAEASPGASA